MVVLRPHLALTVSDVERALPFYEALFGVEAEKRRPGYAKLSVQEPALSLTLNQGEPGARGAFNHGGVQVATSGDVLAARDRLAAAGLATRDEMETTCCDARQDKVWVRDPDGNPWEVFVVHGDVEEPAVADPGRAGEPCCAETCCA